MLKKFYTVPNHILNTHPTFDVKKPELVFVELILQIFYWFSEIVIHSGVFILDLPASTDLWNLYYYILAGNGVLGSLY
jgi:hypothetical protein